VDERRLTIWRALSELFLDTELDTAAYARIAQVVAASGYVPGRTANHPVERTVPVTAR
jgi:hypothetical protein